MLKAFIDKIRRKFHSDISAAIEESNVAMSASMAKIDADVQNNYNKMQELEAGIRSEMQTLTASLIPQYMAIMEHLNHMQFAMSLSAAQSNSNYIELVRGNTRFEGLHKGKRCFILGNGPSIRTQNLSLLADEITFTVNKISYLDGFEKIKTNYHFWADEIFFESTGDDDADAEKLAYMKRVALSWDDLECFVPVYHKDYVVRNGLDQALNINYFDYSFAAVPPILTDFSNKISAVYNVVHAAIFLAVYMGFSEIYLLGCESNNIVSFINAYENENMIENAYAYKVSENDKMIFKRKREQHKMEAFFMSTYRVFRDYRIIDEHCKKHNIYLCNCTPGGLLDVLPREAYEDVISREWPVYLE